MAVAPVIGPVLRTNIRPSSSYCRPAARGSLAVFGSRSELSPSWLSLRSVQSRSFNQPLIKPLLSWENWSFLLETPVWSLRPIPFIHFAHSRSPPLYLQQQCPSELHYGHSERSLDVLGVAHTVSPSIQSHFRGCSCHYILRFVGILWALRVML